MVTPLKSNDNQNNIILPLVPQGADAKKEMEIYARFMRHLRFVPHNQAEVQILSSIQFTADMLDVSDSFVAKILVELGLRAPPQAFPCVYLKFVETSLCSGQWDIEAPSQALSLLKDYWDTIDDNKFTTFKYDLSVTHDTIHVET